MRSRWRGGRGKAGMTLVELIIASAISTAVAVGLMSLTYQVTRMARSVYYQQVALSRAQKAVEGINREIRQAMAGKLRVLGADGAAAARGNRVEFNQPGEPDGQRALELVTDDDNLKTPWDNRLIYDPDTHQDGDEVTLARWLTPMEAAGAFSNEAGAASPLIVWMRCGDPGGGEEQRLADAASGPGIQGIEINIAVGPRN